jgi:peptidoglycan/xylan/chitin deacetylase (PgdA/CDA1 family)
MNKHGLFIISLDLELYWGVRDVLTLDEYRPNLEAVHDVVPSTLELFREHNIHATWAVVGFLFAHSKEHVKRIVPKSKPHYVDSHLDPFQYIERANLDELKREHFAPDLVKMIRSTPNQELGTHTMSHYYCLEDGQTIENFSDDLVAVKELYRYHRIPLRSFVFPRNQWQSEHLTILKEHGLTCFRGNESSYPYRPTRNGFSLTLQRPVRLLDRYFNITGHNVHTLKHRNGVVNVPSSRFLAPVSNSLKLFEPLRIRRIVNSMAFSAINKRIFHLWWHPHNFGKNTERNFEALKKVLGCYLDLRDQFGFQSMNMSEAAELA